MPVTEDKKTTTRFGSRRANKTKVLRKAIVADEAAPTTKLEGLKLDEHVQCQWTVIKPVGVTSYSLGVYARVEALNASDESVVAEWVLIDDVTGLTESAVYYQYIDTQLIQVRVHDIVVGAGIGDGFWVLYTGLGRQ